MKQKTMQILAVCILCGILGIYVWQGRERTVSLPGTESIFQISKEETAPDQETESSTAKKDSALVLKEENVAVHIPGLKNTYKFIFVSDLHIIVENDEISPESLENVWGRHEIFQSEDGKYSSELWEELPAYFNSQDADAVLLGGDMIDYASTANINTLKTGIGKMDAPVLYVRADHDYNPYNCEGLDKKDMKKLHESIDGYEELPIIEFEDLCVVGINNSTKQISKKQLKKFREAADIGKPIILLTHVPLESKIDASLSEESKEVWQNRSLVWGEGCAYEPNENTKAFLDMVYDVDSPVKAVVCGHLHFTWDGKLTENCSQHVFSAMYPGNYGIIMVDGEEDHGA